MKLTVDCALSHHLLSLSGDSVLARLLSKAKVRLLDLPLEAVVAIQHGLVPRPDYPIAPIAAHADGLSVADYYWLRAEPVHLLLQRDSFSLSEPVPLQVMRDHAEAIIASLNQHFAQDGMVFMAGNSGAWYLRLNRIPEIKTSLPSVALDRNIYPFMPQGAEGSAWLSYLNEVQMLLHDHPVNMQRESHHEPAINSVWFSGGGVMPQPVPMHGDWDLLVANAPFYQGLAKWAGLSILSAQQPLTKLLQQMSGRASGHASVRLELPGQHLADEMSFHMLWDALRARQISELTLNLGCYEKTLVAVINPLDTYKFWRSRQSIGSYLQ